MWFCLSTIQFIVSGMKQILGMNHWGEECQADFLSFSDILAAVDYKLSVLEKLIKWKKCQLGINCARGDNFESWNNVFREQGGDRLLQQWCLCTTTTRTLRLYWLGTSRESRSTATRTPSLPTPMRLGPTATTRTRFCVTSSSTGNRLTNVALCSPSNPYPPPTLYQLSYCSFP